MRRFTLIILLSASCITSAFGFEGRIITGKIIGIDGEPLIGATVMLKDGDKSLGAVACDMLGRYTLTFNQNGNDTLTLKISSIGYDDKRRRFLPTQNASTFNFALTEKPIDYGTMVVTPKSSGTELMTSMSSEKIELAAHRSLITTNPTGAIRQAQVIREGSNHSSKIRVNGTSPTYFINGMEIGYDPNHYGMFSIVPGSIVDKIRFYPQGTSSAFCSPSVIEFDTPQSFNSKLHSEMDLSFVEGTGSLSLGNSRFFLLSSIRESILDKLANKITPKSKQKSIPPTNFRDIFNSGGFKALNHLKLYLDHYEVNDYLSYNLGATSRNPGGINTLQDTGERFLGMRVEGLYKRLSFKLDGAIKESRERYRAASIGADSLTAFLVDLSSQSRTNLADFEINLLLGKTRITAGDNLKYINDRQISLRQINWNFLAPDANSDIPFIYQRELNEFYGSYNKTDGQLGNAGYFSIKQSIGPLEIESGIRGEYFQGLEHDKTLLWRNSVLFKSRGFGAWGLFYGTYANSPVDKILESYQVLVQDNLSRLRPVQTDLASISWAIGPLKLGAFKKEINYLPRISPDFSAVSDNGVAGKDFLVMSPDGQINSFGADITFEVNNIKGWDLYSYYGYTHADKITKDISVPYELNAAHKLYAQAGYKLTKHLRVGTSFSLHTGFPYTRTSAVGDIQSADSYTADSFQKSIIVENSSRFPINLTSELFLDFTIGRCQTYATISNISNHKNPIISTVDGFIYDAGILPSLGISYKF